MRKAGHPKLLIWTTKKWYIHDPICEFWNVPQFIRIRDTIHTCQSLYLLILYMTKNVSHIYILPLPMVRFNAVATKIQPMDSATTRPPWLGHRTHRRIFCLAKAPKESEAENDPVWWFWNPAFFHTSWGEGIVYLPLFTRVFFKNIQVWWLGDFRTINSIFQNLNFLRVRLRIFGDVFETSKPIQPARYFEIKWWKPWGRFWGQKGW